MRKLQFLFVITILATVLLMPAPAQAADPSVTLDTDAATTYRIGDFIEIPITVRNYTPGVRPVSVYLIERPSLQRFWLGNIRVREGQTNYTFRFRVPENFFTIRRLMGESARFHIALNGISERRWTRALSTNLITVLNEKSPTAAAPSTGTSSGTSGSTSVETTVDVANWKFIARYNFVAQFEAWEVRKFTVVNDSQNDGFDYDLNENTSLIRRVMVQYKDKNGNTQQRITYFAGGRAILNNLNLFAPRDTESSVEVYAELMPFSELGSDYSGRTFRLGIQDIGNNGTSFEAIGLVSNNVDIGLNTINLSSGNSIKESIYRKAVPTISILSGNSQVLTPGQNDGLEFEVHAKGGSMSVGRLVFDVTQGGVSTLDQIQLLRDGATLTAGTSTSANQVYLMWDAGASSCFAQTVSAGAGTGMNCNGGTQSTAKLIVAFPYEEIISEGQKVKYRLRFSASGTSNGSLVSFKLADDDHEKLSIGGTVPTTGKLFNSGSGNEIFTSATDFFAEASSITNADIVWSDRSAAPHQYPTTTPAASPSISSTGSTDWTNGYLLNVTGLPSVAFSR